MKHPERMPRDPGEATQLADPAHPTQGAYEVVETAAPDAARPVIHMPSPSYWPLLCALGLFIMASGLLVSDSVGPVVIPIFGLAGPLLLIRTIYALSFYSP